jgi:hypothetical protein
MAVHAGSQISELKKACLVFAHSGPIQIGGRKGERSVLAVSPLATTVLNPLSPPPGELSLSCSEIWFVCTRTISHFTGDIARGRDSSSVPSPSRGVAHGVGQGEEGGPFQIIGVNLIRFRLRARRRRIPTRRSGLSPPLAPPVLRMLVVRRQWPKC